MFENFFGNAPAAAVLAGMVRGGRIPQTLLLAGPEGVGKATLARRFAAALLGGAADIERDDLSLAANAELLGEREKLPGEKRAEEPLMFGAHPDFLTFPPDGPLRQISIQQMRLLKERAQFGPLHGRRRVFLIDQIDRANEQAANSLLKTLEEPPPYLIVVMTAQNPYDLLPTIRSRSIPVHLTPLTDAEVLAFARGRGLSDLDRRVALAGGSPGVAASVDLAAYDRRRAAMLALLETAASRATWAAWARHSDTLAQSRSEKLENHLKVLYLLLEDILRLANGGGGIRNADVRPRLESLAGAVSFAWIRRAVGKVDELAGLLRRNIQRGIALDALVIELRSAPGG